MYNRESRIMRKLLGKGPPETPTGDSSNLSITSAPSLPTSARPSKSQNAVYPAGVPILALDASPDRCAAVLGGPHILKTVVLDDADSFNFTFHDGVDIRAAITSQPSGAKGTQVADQLSIRDVKWQAGANGSSIVTACANGKIFAYDIGRLGSGTAEPFEYIQVQEDSRQINTLDVNPHLKSWLLSGSQDGTARVFDTSAPQHGRSGVLTFRQRFPQLKCIDSVRQVKWSPRVGHEMACCTESGVVLKWDIRQAARPLLRINAHEKACTSIAWHPDGIHLVSAGWDTRFHVWDLSSTADKRQKPKYTVSTPAPISAIAWRPGLWSATAQSKRVAQVAVSYDESSQRRYGTSVVHIWDLARPTMPYKEIERFDSSPTSFLWQDQDMLWTVGQDGLFNQCDIAFAPKVIDRQSTSAMAFSPTGEAVMFLDERSYAHRPRPPSAHQPELIARGGWGSTPSTPMLSISRSDSEDDVIGTFLGPRRKINWKRSGGSRSGQSLSTTPPSAPSSLPDESKQLLGLDQGIKVTGIFRSQQTMAFGRIPATTSPHTYQYLSGVYLEVLERDLPCVEGGKSLDERVSFIMEKYATAAETVRLFRLSQTWRILAYAVRLLLKRRAQYHRETRLGKFPKQKADDKKGSAKLKVGDLCQTLRISGDTIPRRASAPSNINITRSFSSQSLLNLESTSNVTTPMARPVDRRNGSEDSHLLQVGKKLEAVSQLEAFSLGPSITNESPRKRFDSGLVSDTSQESNEADESNPSQLSSTEGYDFYDTEVFTNAMDVPPPKKKEPLSIEPTIPEDQKLSRHDSMESYSEMFSISDGNKQVGSRIISHGGPWKSSLARHASEDRQEEEEAFRHNENGGPKPDRRKATIKDSPEEIFLISQTTVDSDELYPSQTSEPEPVEQEPDATEIISTTPKVVETPLAAPASIPSRSASPVKCLFPMQSDSRPYVVETDFLPWEDPPYPFEPPIPGTKPPLDPPLDPYTLISRALAFESRTSALNAAALVLLLRPLVPDNVIDCHQANGILLQHHSRLMRMGLFVEAAVLRNVCIRGWPSGLPEWGDSYTAIFTPSQQGVKVGFFCSSCRKPRETDPKAGDSAIWTCERCRAVMAPCAVCAHREPEPATFTPTEISTQHDAADPSSMLSQWWYCPGCSHGGHSACLQTWHGTLTPSDAAETFSDGCCPLDGCGHACLPGVYRGETSTLRSEELGRAAVEKSRSSRDLERKSGTSSAAGSRRSSPRPSVVVKSDGNDVPQSRAVGMAREALNNNKSAGVAGGGILSSSPGRIAGSGERERRKSVKFAGTDR